MDEDLRIRPKRKVHFISSFIFISIHKEYSLQFFSSVKKFPPSLSLSLVFKIQIKDKQTTVWLFCLGHFIFFNVFVVIHIQHTLKTII